MRNYFTLCLIALVMVGGTGLRARTVDPDGRPGPPRVAGPHVRGTTTRMTEMLTEAIKRSPTFAALVTAIDNTDVIVHVEEVRQLPVGVDGRLTFVHAAGGVRYLRAQILGGRGAIDTMSTVGHELQHALEVATQPKVRDLASFATLYMQIGDQPIRSDRFDTAAAREAGRRVRNEMN